MPKKGYIAIIVIIILVVASAAAFYALQQTPPADNTPKYLAGVKAGDTFTYSINGLSEQYETNETIPHRFLEFNQTDYYKVTITNVDGPIVTLSTSWRFLNGTQNDQNETINVATGTDNVDFWGIYAADLTQGSLLRPLGTADGATFNYTESRAYADGNRTANVLTLNAQFYNTEDPTFSQIYYGNRYLHVDELTGMMVEFKEIKIYTDPQIMLTVQWELIDSNVLQVSS